MYMLIVLYTCYRFREVRVEEKVFRERDTQGKRKRQRGLETETHRE